MLLLLSFCAVEGVVAVDVVAVAVGLIAVAVVAVGLIAVAVVAVDVAKYSHTVIGKDGTEQHVH